MDHADLVSTRDVGPAPSLTTLRVSLPYGCSHHRVCGRRILSGDGNSSPLSPTSLPSCDLSERGVHSGTLTNTWSLAKPTLDISHIRFCPEDSWVPDAQVLACMAHECNVPFSLFNRKHHCRVCGRIFCSACCSHTIKAHKQHRGQSYTSTLSPIEGVDSGRLLPFSSNYNLDTSFTEIKSSSSSNSSPTGRRMQQQQRQPSNTPLTVMSSRICSTCYHEIQLVISRRDHYGNMRRKCRGELKMIQWPLLVRMLSYLDMHDLLEVSLVSSDFYFITRDNAIWYQYNVSRFWQKEPELNIPVTPNNSQVFSLRQRFLKRSKPQEFTTEFGDVTSTDTSIRVISLNARYNFTQFLHFAHRQEMMRCKGLLSFSAGARTLLSTPLNIAIIGPSGVGKTSLVQHFAQQQNARMEPWDSLPTMGFVRHEKTVHLIGGLTTDVTLHIFDISGEPRFAEIRRFICSSCHAVGLCYDARRKVTLVEAAEMMISVDPVLGPQPIVSCGIIRPVSREKRTGTVGQTGEGEPIETSPVLEVTEMDAEAVTERSQGSVLCAWNDSRFFFQQLLQSLLNRLAFATTVSSSFSLKSVANAERDERDSVMHRTLAQELLDITIHPSPLDLLMDRK